MTTGTNGRGEDDLRAALTTLERHAPDADKVLRAVRERTERHTGTPRPLAARPLRRAVLLAGAAAVALAAGLTAALLPDGSPGPQAPAAVQIPGQSGSTAQPPITSRHGLPATATVGKAMATAFSAAVDDILYTTETGLTHGYVPSILQSWSWPAQPVLGQKEYIRSYLVQRTSRSKPLRPAEDNGFVYNTPPAGASYVTGRLTMVCFASFGGCGYGGTETPGGSWASYHGRFFNPNPGLDDLSPRSMAQSIAKGDWRIVGHTRLDGQAALELSETAKARDQYDPKPALLWINEHSYLPLKMITGAGTSQPSVATWSFLTPTPAHLTLLRPHIPLGFPHRPWPQG
jgi:hypothetical protein